jgi:hypothetical protein
LKAELENFNAMRDLKAEFAEEDDCDRDFGEHIWWLSNVPLWFYYAIYPSRL